MKFERFEDMQVWRDARNIINTIYRLTSKERFSKDYGLKEQMQRASVSVMSNIAEGYERHTKKEFAAFLYHSKGSIGELRSQLYVALDLGYINEKEFIEAYNASISISKQFSGLINYLQNKN